MIGQESGKPAPAGQPQPGGAGTVAAIQAREAAEAGQQAEKRPAAPPRRALVHPVADFWLLGGLSYLGLLAMWAATDIFRLNIKYDVPWWAFYAAFAVNYPHFAYSYQLFYRRYPARLFGPETEFANRVRLAVAGIVVPMLMTGYFLHVGLTQDRGLLAHGVSAMLFFVGWHYVKQGYGVLITASVYKGIFYGTWQKRILYGNAYAVWIYAWIQANAYLAQHRYYDVGHYTLGLPRSWETVAGIAAAVTTVAAAVVLLRVWRTEKKGFSLNGFVGYTSASYFWVLLPHVHPLFFYFIPLFHSLQYLPFVYKFKKSEFTKKRAAAAQGGQSPQPPWKDYLWLALFAFGGVALGGLMMDWLPRLFDRQFSTGWQGFSVNFFLVSFLLFINIHHFFIDNAFWRRDNRDVQQYLFRA